MKKVIRRGTFETNSSSTHSLTWCTEKQFEDWRSGELYVDTWNNKFYTKEEYIKLAEEVAKEYNCTVEEVLERPTYYDLPSSWEEYRSGYLELDWYKHTTEHGDTVIAVCQYGYDG